MWTDVHMQVILCVVGRRQLSLSSPNWFPSESSPCYMEEYLYHLGLKLGALFAKLDRVLVSSRDTPIPSAPAAADAVREMAALEGKFVGWYSSYKSTQEVEALYWTDSALVDAENLDKPGFAFRSLSECGLITTYFSLRLLLTINMAQASRDLAEIITRQRVDEQGMQLDSVFTTAHIERLESSSGKHKRFTMAETIVRCMPFLTRDEIGIEAMHGALFPISSSRS